MPRIGSLNDLFPKKGSEAWAKLPAFIQQDLDLIRKGYRPLSPGQLAEHDALPKRVDMLAVEIKTLTEKLGDVHSGQSELGEKLIPLVQKMIERVDALVTRVTGVEVANDKHAARLDAHEAKHAEHTDHLHEVRRRLEHVELAIAKKKRSKSRRTTKGTRK